MAFSQPNAQREQNRRILEELTLKKQMLLKQGPAAPANVSGAPSAAPAVAQQPAPVAPQLSAAAILPQMTEQHLNASNRAVLNQANATSCGYFVPQDSLFGNQILPVLPRFDSK